MINLLVKFEPIFIFIFTCKCNLHVFFIFIWWPKFLWERKFGQQTKRKNTCNNEMKMEVSTLEFSVQRRISKSLFIN